MTALSGGPRVAAIDCGTNSVRLLIADAGPIGGLAEVTRELRLTRLGQGVDATGEFAHEALERTFAAFDDYASVIADHGATSVRVVATSAARDARNREQFFAGVLARVGVEPEVIAGEEEARLSFVGARAGGLEVADPALVMDIGGGSTELVLGSGDQVTQGVSLDVGSVRVRERFLFSDPPTQAEIDAARGFVGELLDGCPVALADARGFLGVAGTVTTLASIHLGLERYDRAAVDGTHLDAPTLADLADWLLGATVDDVCARYPVVPRQRAEVLCAGALIASAVVARTGTDGLIVSESDILDGVALELLLPTP